MSDQYDAVIQKFIDSIQWDEPKKTIEQICSQRNHAVDLLRQCLHRIVRQAEKIERLTSKIEAKDEALHRIKTWADAYPLEVFPELTPEQWAIARQRLKECGLNLSAVSVSNMRHVLDGVKTIVEQAQKR